MPATSIARKSSSVFVSLRSNCPVPCPPSRRTSAPTMLVDVPLLTPRKLSYKRICEQAASAIAEATSCEEPLRLLAVDFPPDRAEQRAGTLVSRYEHNLNMCQTILEELGVVTDSWTTVGTDEVGKSCYRFEESRPRLPFFM